MTIISTNYQKRNPTWTISRVERELIDGKPSIARFPLQHKSEGLSHVHGNLGPRGSSPT